MKIRYMSLLFILLCFSHALFAGDYNFSQKAERCTSFSIMTKLDTNLDDISLGCTDISRNNINRFVKLSPLPDLPKMMVDKQTPTQGEKSPERTKPEFFFEYSLPKLDSLTSFKRLWNLKKQRLGLWFSHNPTREINISGMFGKKANSWKTTSSVEAEYYQKFGSFESLSISTRVSLGNIKVDNLSDGGDISAILSVKYNF
ncbi:hypothetical protein ACFL22_00430 [Patescibacteria group bacterium]